MDESVHVEGTRSVPRRPSPLLTVLVIVAVGLVSALAAIGAGLTYAWQHAAVDTTGEVDFDRPLVVPPLDTGTLDARGRRVFDLRAQEGSTDLGGDRPSSTWGFNGAYLGPTLRAERGDQVLVNVTNDLPATTSVHWHGMHLPARMDGGPHQPVHPGRTWSPTWRVDQPAATLWYHPHPHGETADHVSRGLAGMVILGDDEEARLGLPRTYGVDDLPAIVQDKDLRADGGLGAGEGRTMVVNGTPGAYVDVSTERVRLRLLNASTMRVMNFRLDNDGRFDLVASDGGLLPRSVPTDHVQLSPGERAEVVLTFGPGETRVLRSERPDLGGNIVSNHFDGGAASFDLLQLRAAPHLTPSTAVPEVLSTTNDATASRESDAVRTRLFTLNGREINGRGMDMGRIDFATNVGDTELWTVVNESGSSHSFHVHDVQFRVLSVDGAPPPPELGGLKDTIYLRPHAVYRLLLRFDDYADAAAPYMVHCHLLRHEDQGMMAQFVVVHPGQGPDVTVAPDAANTPAVLDPLANTHAH